MAMGSQAVGCAIGKPIGAVLLGGIILWRVASLAGPQSGQAIVHVAITPVDVAVDDETYRVETMDRSPLVCELRPGVHMVRMMRDGRVLFREEIHIDAGEDFVLVVWDRSDDRTTTGGGYGGPPH